MLLAKSVERINQYERGWALLRDENVYLVMSLIKNERGPTYKMLWAGEKESLLQLARYPDSITEPLIVIENYHHLLNLFDWITQNKEKL